MKRLVAGILLLAVLVGCGGPPSPTPDLVATQIAVEEAAHATMTARAPTATPTATDVPTPAPTCTPSPTPTPAVTLAPSATPLPRRLETGTFVSAQTLLNPAGEGEITIENGLDLDAVAILVNVQTPKVKEYGAVYVLNHDSYTLAGVADATYYLYFMVGEDWDADQNTFARQLRHFRFEDTFEFTTTTTEYTTWSVTLHPVEGGTAQTEEVPPDEFP